MQVQINQRTLESVFRSMFVTITTGPISRYTAASAGVVGRCKVATRRYSPVSSSRQGGNSPASLIRPVRCFPKWSRPDFPPRPGPLFGTRHGWRSQSNPSPRLAVPREVTL